MAELGLIGAGLMAAEMARLAVAAGMEVTVANSRGPDTLSPFVEEVGPRTRAASIEEVAEADVVVLALPLGRLGEVSQDTGLHSGLLDGRVVLDLTNYYPHRDGRIAELDTNSLTAGQYVRKLIPNARLVRTFSNISYRHIPELARPAGATDRTALPVAGDDLHAKEIVTKLMDRLGYDAVDAGGLDDSWRFEPNTVAYLLCYTPDGTALEDLQTTPGAPAGADRIRTLLGGAVRTDQSSRAF